jgi:hypothetical protein
MPPDADKYTATSIAIATRQRLRDFKTLLIRRGIPDGIEPPTSLTLSTTINVALDIALQAMAGAAVALEAKKSSAAWAKHRRMKR